MSLTEGMDVQQVRAAAAGLRRSAEQVQQLGERGTRSMEVLQGCWQGPDVEAFDGQWRGAQRQITDLDSVLQAFAERLEDQAGDQDDASAAGRGGPSGSSGGGRGGADEGVGSGNPDIHGDEEGVEYEDIEGPVVTGGVDPEDVKQGALGDCWLISTMKGVAQANPGLIEDNITDNGDGTYTVTIYEDGEPVEVTITGDFPAADGDPVYADNDGGGRELWPMLYEKAMALHLGGSYGDLDGDWPARAMEALTGNEVTTYDEGLMPWDDKDLPPAGDLRATLEDGGIIVASTDGDGKKASDGDLVSNHAYTVTGIDEDGDVTVQNPWGKHEPPITMSYEEFEDRFARFDVGSTS